MATDTVECYNCGRPNPSWAQVCRSCGVPIRAGATPPTTPSGPIPTDQDSLVSMGAGVGSIVIAILLGIFLSGIIPPATAPPDPTATPRPTRTPRPSPSEAAPSVAASTEPTPEPTPALPGVVTFGFGLNQSTREAIDLTDTFRPGTTFCHSLAMTEPFGAPFIQEEILRIEEGGELKEVQARTDGTLGVVAGSSVYGWCADADLLINGWGPGDYVLRDYRGTEAPELIAEGRFSLTR